MSVTFQLFAKAPVAGSVKTRLVPPLSPSDAARLHARMVERAAATVRRVVDRLAGSRGELWCAPDADDPHLQRIAGRNRLALRVQADGDLGDRMRTALSEALPGRVVLLGSDIPALGASHLLDAANALDDHDAVVIPSDDGGYVTICCRDRVPDCFEGIAWSTSGVMQQTRARLDASGIRWTELPPLWDVDVPADLDRLAADPALASLLEGIETIRGSPLVLHEDQPV